MYFFLGNPPLYSTSEVRDHTGFYHTGYVPHGLDMNICINIRYGTPRTTKPPWPYWCRWSTAHQSCTMCMDAVLLSITYVQHTTAIDTRLFFGGKPLVLCCDPRALRHCPFQYTNNLLFVGIHRDCPLCGHFTTPPWGMLSEVSLMHLPLAYHHATLLTCLVTRCYLTTVSSDTSKWYYGTSCLYQYVCKAHCVFANVEHQ